ncbi:MAG: gamma-glutamyltransferase [Synergistaceae bacterium]|nr:gamma-glutamyltransferase [Synergistaceae bacterium]
MTKTFGKVLASSLAVILAMSGTSFAAPDNALIMAGENGMAVTTQPLADMAGQLILDSGGNAIDAAVAVGYALAVVHPQAGNIGGGGFAIIHTADGKDYALDFREMAPGAATRDMYLDDKGNVIPGESTGTYKAAGIPGTVAGMSAMLERFGTKTLSEVMATAIELAEKGYILSERQAGSMAAFRDKLYKFPASRKYFLKPDGTAYEAGERFIQSDLAETLKRISAEGPKGFYEGKTAELIEADMKANGGLITLEDLKKYTVKWREPSTATYRGYKIVSMCPPSSGGAVVAEILNVMENADMRTLWAASPAQAIHVMAEAMRQAYADRSEYMGDPDFVKVPVDELTSKEYAKKIFDRINPSKATPSDNVRPGLAPLKEGTNTTHYSVVDKFGNAVSVTYTINDSWGSGASVEGAGFLLNNEMDDFSVKPGVPNIYGLVGGDANAVAPFKRPLSSMSPSIVSKDGKTILVVGSPGGARIITTVLQVIANVIDRRMSVNAAVSAPRYHMQWLPDDLRIEPGNGLSPADIEALVGMGYKLSLQPFMGDVNVIMIDPDTGVITGSHDSRHEY